MVVFDQTSIDLMVKSTIHITAYYTILYAFWVVGKAKIIMNNTGQKPGLYFNLKFQKIHLLSSKINHF